MKRFIAVLGALAAVASGIASGPGPTVADALKAVRVLAIPANGRPVDRTVAEEFRRDLAPRAEIRTLGPGGAGDRGILRIAVADEKLAAGPGPGALGTAGGKNWMFLELAPDGTGQLVASAPHLLYALYRLLKDDWLGLDAAGFAKGRVVVPRFTRLEGGDNYLANPKRAAAGYDPEASVRELARLGFSHVPVNALAKDMPAEQGPPGEIYYRFYYFSPDLDQFVETPLNAGAYSPEYLEANLALLKENARLAVKYGLTPGLNISSPRSVPDAVLEKHPYLRGARVDHPFRSYRPRFTLTLSHPAVRWHYAELVRRLMKEVPDLGYIYLWTNDSGSGFEYTASLYAGRNGGAYLVREWKSHEAVAKAAAENVLRYFRTLRDAALETRPDFRLLFNLFSFSNEEEFILDGLGEGLDLWVAPKELDDSPRGRRLKALPQRGSEIFTTTRLQNNYLLGIPSPWLAAEEVRALSGAGFDKAQVTVDPAPLAPYDVNREVLRALNFDAGRRRRRGRGGGGRPARRRGRRARSRRGLAARGRGRPRLPVDHALRRQQLGLSLVPPARPALRPGHREDPRGRARLLREVHDRDLQQSQPRRPGDRHPLDAHDHGSRPTRPSPRPTGRPGSRSTRPSPH